MSLTDINEGNKLGCLPTYVSKHNDRLRHLWSREVLACWQFSMQHGSRCFARDQRCWAARKRYGASTTRIRIPSMPTW